MQPVGRQGVLDYFLPNSGGVFKYKTARPVHKLSILGLLWLTPRLLRFQWPYLLKMRSRKAPSRRLKCNDTRLLRTRQSSTIRWRWRMISCISVLDPVKSSSPLTDTYDDRRTNTRRTVLLLLWMSQAPAVIRSMAMRKDEGATGTYLHHHSLTTRRTSKIITSSRV